MKKKKPYSVIEERLKANFIIIGIYKTRRAYSYDLSASIGDGGIGYPKHGEFKSFFLAKNAALRSVARNHQSPRQRVLLKKFRIMRDLDQPLLFYD